MKFSKIILLVTVLGMAMSCGVHRVAQSRWNCPQANRNTKLSFYFVLDNPLPVAGVLNIGIPSASGFTPTAGAAWTLADSWTAPTTVENLGTCAFANNVYSCSFATALAKNVAYGVELTGAATTTVGSFAPVTMQTRMNNAGDAGPIIDTNWVFDQMVVQAAPLAMTLTATKVVTDPVKEFPGETAAVDFVWTFASSTAATPFTPISGTSFMVHLQLGTTTAVDRAASTDAAVQLYPQDYADWKWTATCTNVQFGNDSEDTAVTPHPKLAADPTCVDTNGELTFTVPALPTSTDWSTWSMKFQISVTMPSDRILVSTTVDSWFSDLADEQVYAVAAQVTSFMTVSKPTTAVTATGIVAFGKDPADATQQGQGVGVYSSIFCFCEGTATAGIQWIANTKSNCGITSATSADTLVSNANTALVVNSIEMEWTIPYAVPNDRTEASMICALDNLVAPTTVPTRWSNDPMMIYSSSFVANNMGTANCFYDGVLNTNAAVGQHNFKCTNIGAITSGTKLGMSFQFAINNQAKTIAMDNVATNSVQWAVTQMTCTLKVNTWSSDSSSAVEWVSQAYSTKIDGNGQTSKFGEFSSFVGTSATQSSTCQHEDTQVQEADNQNIELWLVMDNADMMGADTVNKRQFPWAEVGDTSATQLDFRAYGVGLQSDATLTITAPATYHATQSFACQTTTTATARATCIDMGTGVATKAAESSPPTGMIAFQLGNNAWGGSCCTSAACAGGTANDNAASCDKLNPVDANGASTVWTHPFMSIANGGALNPVHSLTKTAAAGTLQSISVWKLNSAMLMPAYLTTFRGRGGWGTGDSNQKLMDVFVQMRSTASSAPSIQVLSHFYIGAKAANDLTDANANVKVSYPLATYATIDNAMTNEGSNTGASVLNTGVKLFITAAAAPPTTHVGVFTLRMTPFYKSTGANQVEVVVSTARTVSCWVYSSSTGGGFCLLHADTHLGFFTGEDLLYKEAVQYGGMGLLVCEIGTAAGTATTGDAIFIPATQQEHAAVAAQYLPGLGTEEDATAGLATAPMNNLGGALLCATDSSNHNPVRMMFGSEKNLYTMTRISAGTALDDIVQADNVVGASSNAAIPYWYATTTTAQYNDNDSSNNEFDMDAVTGTAWIYGGTGIATLLTTRNEGAVTWAHVQDAMVVCTPVTGSALPASLVITAGTDGTGSACAAAFAYSYLPTATTRSHRQCRWCSATFSSTKLQLHIADYTPPVTPKRTIAGVSIWAVEGTTGDDSYYTPDTIDTIERLLPTATVAGSCGANPAKIAQSTLAQSVAFTFKTTVPLASGQVVVWQETTSTGNVGWAITTIPANSVTCTCAGHATWTQAQSNGFVRTSANRFTLTIPDLAATDGTETTCTAGDVVCTVRGWNSGAAPANDMTATCFACDANTGSDDCTKEESAAADNAGQGVMSYAVAATVTYSQDGTAVATVLSIKDVAYYPNSKTARGRLSYKLKDTATVYGGSTTVAYTFGGQTFGADARCQIYAESTEMRGYPGDTMMSDRVTNCVIAGQTVTLTLASSKTDFHVAIVAMDAWLASDTNKITGVQQNFATNARSTTATTDDQVQMVTLTAYGANKAKLMNQYSNTPTVGEVVLTRSLTNVMDLGMIQLAITVKGTYSLDGDSYVMVSFPSYYNPGLGNMNMPRCVWRDAENAADAETVYCYAAWDWQLMVMGPKTAVATAGKAYLRVFGVAMNSFSTAGTFGVGIMNQTSHTNLQVNEWGETTDGTTGAFGGVLPITVSGLVVQNTAMRASTSVTIDFTLPATTGTVTEGADYVALQLPWGVPTWQDGSATPNVVLELVETAADGTVTKTEAAGALEMVTGCDFVYKLATDATKMAETKTYKLTVKNVPTNQNTRWSAMQNLQNFVLSVGLMASGGKGYSHAQNMPAIAKATLPAGMQLLDFTAEKVSINRGTYQNDAVCVKPGVANQNFQSTFTWKSASSDFKTVPAEVTADMGDATSCAALGAASSVREAVHHSYWTVTGTNMSPLPSLPVVVGRAQTNVNVPSAVTCQAGGFSFPMVVNLAAQPFTDIKVALKEDVDNTDAANPVDNSYGVTIDAASKAGMQFEQATDEVVLGFQCAADANATSLKYELTGTDAANFRLANAKATVTVLAALEAGTAQPSATVTLAMVADSSNAGRVTVEGACPKMGASIIHWSPMGQQTAAMADWAAVQAAYDKFSAQPDAEEPWNGEQFCMVAVTSEGAKSTCAFESESRAGYNATLYCRTIENWFYASAVTDITAPDNGGVPVAMTLTYSKAIDVRANNAVVLNVCGKIAETLQVPYNRVTDELGGYFGVPSPLLNNRRLQEASAAATTSTEASNSTNATVQTEWKLELFVQPDPRAVAVVSADTATALADAGVLTAINTVTSKDFGAPTVVAATVTEAAVAWNVEPTGASATKAIVVSGSMTAAGYVYCATDARRLQEASAATSAEASAVEASAEASAAGNSTEKAEDNLKWVRAKVTAADLKFSIEMPGAEGATLKWACVGTSANPDADLAKFKTTTVSGSTATNPAPAPAPAATNDTGDADSALMSSLFAAIIMIVAVFFY